MKLHSAVCCAASLVLVLSACAPTLKRVTDSATPMMANGFSLMPPKGDYWFQMDNLGSQKVIFFKTTPDDFKQTKSLVLSAETLSATKKNDIRSPDGLKAEVDANVRQPVPRHRLVAYQSESYRDEIRGTDCVRVSATNEERDNPNYPGKVFFISGKMSFCRHPLAPEMVVLVGYSERRPTDLSSMIDEAVFKECEDSLNSLRFLPLH
jgi:hypothetical protein